MQLSLKAYACQVVALDFGPAGEADVTANLMESVPCGQIRHEPAEVPQGPEQLPFLRICAPHHAADSAVLTQACPFSKTPFSSPFHPLSVPLLLLTIRIHLYCVLP